MTRDQIFAARNQHEDWLMSLPGVTGTSVGIDMKTDEVSLVIYNDGKTSQEIRRQVSEKLDGIPIAWEDGDILAQ